MNIPKRLLACVATEATRPALHHVYADVESKYACATNGSIAVRIPIEPEDGDCSGYVPRAAIEAADKQPKGARFRLIHREKTTSIPGVGTWDNPQEDATFPLVGLYALCCPQGQYIMPVSLDLLYTACKVLGDKRVRIYYDPSDTGRTLFMENDKGECVVVASLSQTSAERTARSQLRQHCAEEEL